MLIESAVFSLFFEVADKSFKVADRAIHHTCGGTGGVYPEVRAEGGTHTREHTPGTERLNTTLGGGFGGPPPRNFLKSSQEMVNSGSI